jgi:hypothetical protein
LTYDEITGAERIIKELKGKEKRKLNDYSILRKLRHRCIPEMYDAFEVDDALYIVMELVEGNTLKEELVLKKSIVSEIMGYLLDVLDALNYMHSIQPNGIYHGDIKPDNILIADGRAVLIDFGSSEGGAGSSGFCAPEILAGFSPSASSDIYSIGQVIHFCFTGTTKKIFEGNRKGIEKGIYEIIEKAARKAPGERYSAVSEIILDIKRWIDLDRNQKGNKPRPYLICFPGNPHLLCESASVLAREKKILMVDLGILSPGVDILMGIRRQTGSSYEYCIDSDISQGYGIIKGRGKKPDILPCIGNYDVYEENLDKAIERILSVYTDIYDYIMITCSDFPYDSIFQESVFICDYTILSICRGPYDIRKYNTMLLHLSRRQGLNNERIRYMGYGMENCIMEDSVAKSSSEAVWLGNIPIEKSRASLHREGRAYLPTPRSRTFRHIKKTFKEFGI